MQPQTRFATESRNRNAALRASEPCATCLRYRESTRPRQFHGDTDRPPKASPESRSERAEIALESPAVRAATSLRRPPNWWRAPEFFGMTRRLRYASTLRASNL